MNGSPLAMQSALVSAQGPVSVQGPIQAQAQGPVSAQDPIQAQGPVSAQGTIQAQGHVSDQGSHPALEARGVSKRYGGVAAVDGVSVCVCDGEVYGVAGVNGAGKSTLLAMLAGVARPDGGCVLHRGFDVNARGGAGRRARAAIRVGYVPQEIAAFANLSVYDNLLFFASSSEGLFDMGEAALFAAEATGLSDRLRDKASQLSGGMRRRLNIAAALAMRPQALVMDEPTAGLDAKQRRYIASLVESLARGGMSVVYSSHQSGELEAICDSLAVLHKGALADEGRPSALLSRHGAASVDDIICAL